MSDAMDITLSVNGEERALRVPPWRTLLDVLRGELALTGSKNACNQGVCGACTVLIDGMPVNACLTLAVNVTGRDITSVEGLGEGGELSVMQQAFVDARDSMRFLHEWHDHQRNGTPGRQSVAFARGNPQRALGQFVPLLRLCPGD